VKSPEDVLIAHGCGDFIVGGYSDLSAAMFEFAEEYHEEKNKTTINRNKAIDLLEKYNEHLMKEGFADCDLWCEPPTAIDGFLLTKWAKENLPLKKQKNE